MLLRKGCGTSFPQWILSSNAASATELTPSLGPRTLGAICRNMASADSSGITSSGITSSEVGTSSNWAGFMELAGRCFPAPPALIFAKSSAET